MNEIDGFGGARYAVGGRQLHLHLAVEGDWVAIHCHLPRVAKCAVEICPSGRERGFSLGDLPLNDLTSSERGSGIGWSLGARKSNQIVNCRSSDSERRRRQQRDRQPDRQAVKGTLVR